MPKLRNKLPSYCHHKASGQAVVTLDGRDRYLGGYGTPESHDRYRQLIAEWMTSKRVPASKQDEDALLRSDSRVCELLVAYLDFARGYYVKNGRQTGEYVNLKHAVRPLSELYSNARLADFRPSSLKAVRQRMIEAGLSRRVIRRTILSMPFVPFRSHTA